MQGATALHIYLKRSDWQHYDPCWGGLAELIKRGAKVADKTQLVSLYCNCLEASMVTSTPVSVQPCQGRQHIKLWQR